MVIKYRKREKGIDKVVKIPDALKPMDKEALIAETKKHLEKRVKEIEYIFKELCKGKGSDEIGGDLQLSKSYVADMVKRGKEGALMYWKEMYGVKE